MKVSCLFFAAMTSLPAVLHAQVFEIRPPEVTVDAETLVIPSCVEVDEVPAEYRQNPVSLPQPAPDAGLALAFLEKPTIILTKEECIYAVKAGFSSFGDPTTLLITQK